MSEQLAQMLMDAAFEVLESKETGMALALTQWVHKQADTNFDAIWHTFLQQKAAKGL